MNEMRRNLMVGLFVLVGLIALAGLIVLYGQDQLWFGEPAYSLRVKFPQASGIRTGTQATVGGLPIGSVRTVEFADPTFRESGVYVTISFEKGYVFHVGTSARTTTPGLGMGRPPIEIIPGPADNPVLASGAVIPGTMTSAVESLIPREISEQIQHVAQQLGQTAEALQPVLDDMHELLQPRGPEQVDQGVAQGNLSSAMARLDAALKHFNQVFGDPAVRNDLRDTITNLHTISKDGTQVVTDFKAAAADMRTFTGKANKLADTAGDVLKNAQDRYDGVADSVEARLEQLAGVLTDFQHTTAAIKRGEGTLGKVLHDDRLYEALVLTFERLADAAADLRVLLQEWQQGRVRIAL